MSLHDLPALNAALNGAAAVLLAWGFTLIRRGRRRAHRNVMLAAFTVSALFLVSYVVYHAQAGVVRFARAGSECNGATISPSNSNPNNGIQ